MMSAYNAGMGLDTVSLRYFNIFGPRQSAENAYAAVIAAFAKAMLAGKGRQFMVMANNPVISRMLTTRFTPTSGRPAATEIGRGDCKHRLRNANFGQ